MKRIVMFLIFLTCMISVYSSVDPTEEIIAVFEEYAHAQELFARHGSSSVYERKVNELEQESNDNIDILLHSDKALRDFLYRVDSMKDNRITAFSQVIDVLSDRLGERIVSKDNNPDAGELYLITQSILEKIRKAGVLSFQDDSGDSHPLLTLTKAIYLDDINASDEADLYDIMLNSKGWATEVMINVAHEWKDLPDNVRKDISHYTEGAFLKSSDREQGDALQKDTGEIVCRETDNFRVYYHTAGKHAPFEPDKDEDNNGHPDFVDNVCDYLEKAFSYQVHEMGFKEPAMLPLKVTILDMNDYGVTIPDTEDSKGERASIQIDNDFIGENFFTKGTDAAKVTCAHELFHSIQARYGLFRNPFFAQYRWTAEGTAVWMEDAVFTDVNDYLNYINSRSNAHFRRPENPIFQLYPFEAYSAITWFKFLTDRKVMKGQQDAGYIDGVSIIRRIWEKVDENSYTDIEAHLDLFGDDFTEVFEKYCIARYFITYFKESDLWTSRVRILDETDQKNKVFDIPERDAPSVFGANYIKVIPRGHLKNRKLSIEYSGEPGYKAVVLLRTKKGRHVIRPEVVNGEWEVDTRRFGKRYREAIIIIYSDSREIDPSEYMVRTRVR
ncbi:MAG: DUF6055 domain-containing protein [Candidatus Muiribacteriaceae bacterium]